MKLLMLITALFAVGCDGFKAYEGDAAVDAVPADSVSPGDSSDSGPTATCTPCDGGACGCSASYECSQHGACCTDTLSNVGAGDFTITLTLVTRATVQSTVAYQRDTCGSSTFWDVQMRADGTVTVETDDGGAGDYAMIHGTAVVNDGASHRIVVARRGQQMRLSVDGTVDGTAASSSTFGLLSPLGIAHGNPCEAAGLAPLAGTVTDVCLQGF